MPTPLYNYVPIYGVEEHLVDLPAVGGNGGARVDNDNLIITAWEVAAKSLGTGVNPFAFTDLIIPRYSSDGVSDEEKPAWRTPMRGRVGSRFLLSTAGDGGFEPFIVLVLNPPEELKQQLANSVVYNGGDPLDVANYTFTKSHAGQFCWKGLLYESTDPSSSDDGMNAFSSGNGSGTSFTYDIGQYIPLNLFGSQPDDAYLPLLRTNGADGNAPESFDMTTANGVAECIAAVNRGEFYIPMLLDADEYASPGAYFDMWWPHSVNRG